MVIYGSYMFEFGVNKDMKIRIYHRFIAGPTLNNSTKKVEFFWKLSLDVVEIF